MTVYTGAVAPESIQVTVRPGLSGLDMSTVSAAEFHVQKPDGTEVTWAASLSAQTTSSVVLTHTFVLGDVPDRGTYRLVPYLTVPAGTHRAGRIVLNVEDQYRG